MSRQSRQRAANVSGEIEALVELSMKTNYAISLAAIILALTWAWSSGGQPVDGPGGRSPEGQQTRGPGARGGPPGGGQGMPGMPQLTQEQQAAIRAMTQASAPLDRAVTEARNALECSYLHRETRHGRHSGEGWQISRRGIGSSPGARRGIRQTPSLAGQAQPAGSGARDAHEYGWPQRTSRVWRPRLSPWGVRRSGQWPWRSGRQQVTTRRGRL